MLRNDLKLLKIYSTLSAFFNFVELVLRILRQVLGYKMLDYNTCTELFHKIREEINIIEDGEVA